METVKILKIQFSEQTFVKYCKSAKEDTIQINF